MRTTTYHCGSEMCRSCGSCRTRRGVGEYRVHTDGTESLVNCSDCWREKPKPRHSRYRQPLIVYRKYPRHVCRDVACRYIEWFGGSTFALQTDIDVCEVYLRDRDGNIMAMVTMFDKYPKDTDMARFEDIPF